MSHYAALPRAAALAVPITLGAWTVQAADIVQTAEQVGRFIVGLLTMGQILSIPMILLGLYLIVRAYLNAAPVTSRHGRKLQRG